MSISCETLFSMAVAKQKVNRSKEESNASNLRLEDLAGNALISPCLKLTVTDVAQWVESLGFPQYKACFASNYVDGRRLILVNMSTLPRLGVNNFEHSKAISRAIRRLLWLSPEVSQAGRNVCDGDRSPVEEFMLAKARSGPSIDALTFTQFIRSRPWLFDQYYSRPFHVRHTHQPPAITNTSYDTRGR